jgi:rod shape-determining protein MreC
MPLGTLDRSPPAFFKQGASASSKLLVCSALSVFLMVADGRFQISQPVRAALSTALMPLQWLVMQPIDVLSQLRSHAVAVQDALRREDEARKALAVQSQRGMRVEQLELENRQLRSLLGMQDGVATRAQGARVLYDAADPYTRRVVIDKGLRHAVQLGSPVIDAQGVLGQVTQVHALMAEVTLLVDRQQAIPVLNTRTGERGVVYGTGALRGQGLELRYTLANADVKEGDLLTTSGVDGVYPAGLLVAKISALERRTDSTFARVLCEPLGHMAGALHVLVLDPILTAPRPSASIDNGQMPSEDKP